MRSTVSHALTKRLCIKLIIKFEAFGFDFKRGLYHGGIKSYSYFDIDT